MDFWGWDIQSLSVLDLGVVLPRPASPAFSGPSANMNGQWQWHVIFRKRHKRHTWDFSSILQRRICYMKKETHFFCVFKLDYKWPQKHFWRLNFCISKLPSQQQCELLVHLTSLILKSTPLEWKSWSGLDNLSSVKMCAAACAVVHFLYFNWILTALHILHVTHVQNACAVLHFLYVTWPLHSILTGLHIFHFSCYILHFTDTAGYILHFTLCTFYMGLGPCCTRFSHFTVDPTLVSGTKRAFYLWLQALAQDFHRTF